jgi:hypothetical protein
LARYCSGLRVSADRAANRAAHTPAKAAVLDLQRPGLCETGAILASKLPECSEMSDKI